MESTKHPHPRGGENKADTGTKDVHAETLMNS